jgi:ketosteroid isomerase-like protein
MTLEDGVWKLERKKEDFSPLDFSQRFTGTFGRDGKSIEGTWEIAHDHSTYEKDFDITYKKVA